MSVAKVVARALMGGIFIAGGYGAVQDPQRLEGSVTEAGLPHAEELIKLNGAAQVAGGVALGLGIVPRAAAAGLIASMVPTTIVGHAFWQHDDSQVRTGHLMQFLKNSAIVGGLLLVASDSK